MSEYLAKRFGDMIEARMRDSSVLGTYFGLIDDMRIAYHPIKKFHDHNSWCAVFYDKSIPIDQSENNTISQLIYELYLVVIDRGENLDNLSNHIEQEMIRLFRPTPDNLDTLLGYLYDPLNNVTGAAIVPRLSESEKEIGRLMDIDAGIDHHRCVIRYELSFQVPHWTVLTDGGTNTLQPNEEGG